ncbi:MAG TPA: metallophosphoesterase [Gemmatimonadaceae bacterium]|nr:metallophosphoesterase [Gemmatimonadaceae bacterium]
MHHGPYGSTGHVCRAALLIAEHHPDLIALLGDYGRSHRWAPRLSRWAYTRTFASLGACLRELHAPDGVVAVLGNHDHLVSADDVARWLTQQGIHVLVNDHILIRRANAFLAVGGVDDAERGTVDPAGGCATVDATVPRIVLSHNPDGVLMLAPEARADVVLSGHTHGGQIVLPVVGALVRNCTICGAHYTRGWIPNPRAPLFVTSGVGAQIPMRIGTTPEVVLLTLRRGQQPA